MKKFIFPILILPLLLIFFSTGFADRGIKRINNQESRYALIIGNGAYKTAPLKNPVNDSRDMERTLRELNFEVIYRENADQRTMKQAISEFGEKLRQDRGTGLFYFAGHGIQVRGRNYLIPIDAKIETESDAEYESVDAGRILGKMEDAGNKLNIVILDACRNNPFARGFRSNPSGLAAMRGPVGSIIVYATAENSVAADGSERNGLFTKYLLRHIKTPGLKIQDVVMNTRIDVAQESGSKQIPYEYSSLMGNFYFAGSSGTTIVTPPRPDPPKPEPPKPVPPKPVKDGSLKVDANVSGAVVWVNGTKYNKVPMTFTISNPGEYVVRVTAEGYEPYEKREQIDKGADVVVTAYLEKETPQPAPAPVSQNELTNSLSMKFVYIEPGSFMMGSPKNEPNHESDETRHRVTLTRGFYMQTTEVTQGQWKAIMGNNPSNFKNCGDNCPVETVSWEDVQEFIKKLNRKEGVDKYRLPTEAEWEYSARAGTTTAFSTGKCLSTDQANYNGNYPQEGCSKGKYRKTTVSVASFPPNDWGLYDMHGNVYEWCQDWKGDYPAGDVTDPAGPSTGSSRVLRGGSWGSDAQDCRLAYRDYSSPSFRDFSIGFRLVVSPVSR